MAHTAVPVLQERFADFKHQVDALTQQVKCLTHDKECLQSRNDLLETMMEEELKCSGGATRALTSGHSSESADPASSEEVPCLAKHPALARSQTCRACFGCPALPQNVLAALAYPSPAQDGGGAQMLGGCYWGLDFWPYQ